MPPVRVTLDVREPETHLVRVTQDFPATDEPQRAFRMPAWVPGSYKIRDFGRHVQDFKATVAGRAAAWDQPTKDAWVVEGTQGKAVRIQFAVYCRELTVDTSHVTREHAHVFPATVVMYDGASRPLPHRLALRMPRGWRAWSGLETDRLDGTLEEASDYDHLIDCPIEAGPPEAYHVETFEVRGARHRLVTWAAPPRVDWPRIVRDVRAIVAETVKVFGEVPYRHYTFLGHVAEGHGGGLEHRNSTVLGIDPLHLQSDEKVQTRFLPLVAHEFFHTWNVKRILPRSFQPYDLQAELYTDLLWLFEGFTSYYELPILHRAKACDAEAWGKMAAEFIEMYEKALGRRRLPVAQASRLTWTLLYQPHEHNINRNVSYYTKGMWVGLCVDAELRRRGVARGLDAVMAHIWRRHGRTGQGVPEDAFPALVREATGVDLSARLRKWVHGTDELPIDQAMRYLGWTVKRDWKDPKKKHGLGVEFKAGTATVARIWEDMPAYRILQPDDEMVAVEGYRWKSDRFHELVASRKAGDPVEVVVFRDGRLLTAQVPLVELWKEKVTVSQRKKDAAGARRRKAWLGEGKPSKKKGGTAVPKRRARKERGGRSGVERREEARPRPARGAGKGTV